MNKEEFKSNMAQIRASLKGATGTRATVLCMIIAATRGHVHCVSLWQRLDGHRVRGANVNQLMFIAEANTPDPWGIRALSVAEVGTALATIAAADAWRNDWTARVREAVEIEQEQPVLV